MIAELIKIFVCEDDPKQLEQIVSYVKNYLLIENLDMELVLATEDPHEVLKYLEKNKVDRALYLLDINLNADINGIELADKLKERDFNGKFVFVTSHSEMVFLTFKYKLEALDYILKDDSKGLQKRVIEVINACNDLFNRSGVDNEAYYQVKTGNHVRSIRVRDILFFESSVVPHKVIVHLLDGQFEFYSTVKELEFENDAFFRCHKSYVVNVNNIKSIDRHTREITMVNGEKIISSVLACRKLVKMVQE